MIISLFEKEYLILLHTYQLREILGLSQNLQPPEPNKLKIKLNKSKELVGYCYTFIKILFKSPRRRASICGSDNLNSDFFGKELNGKSGNSCFNN